MTITYPKILDCVIKAVRNLRLSLPALISKCYDWKDYYQTCQCMPEASFIVCTLRLLRVARCFDAWQYIPYLL
jgi:hypothetical protein